MTKEQKIEYLLGVEHPVTLMCADIPYMNKEEIGKYKKQLESHPEEELNTMYLEAKKEEENNHFFNSQEAKTIDISYWSDLDRWKGGDLIAFSLSRNPDIVNYNEIKNISYISSSFIKKYNDVERLLNEAVGSGKLKSSGFYIDIQHRKVKPINFIKWAENKSSINLPKQLIEAVNKKSNVANNSDIVLNLTEVIKSTNDKCNNLESDNKKLKEELKEKEDQRVVTTLYKVLCGIIKKHYPNKTNRVSQLQTTILNEAGIEINEKTLRNHIEKALEEDQNKEN